MNEKIRTSELTCEETNSPYSKYYYWQHGPLDEDAVAAFKEDAFFEPSQATNIFRIEELFKPGYLPMELGVCQMPDGSGVFANHIKMPNVTPEMFAWFLSWFPLEDLRYKIWVPHKHYGAAVTDETRQTLMDPARAYTHKVRGTMRYIWEDTGAGCEALSLRMLSPMECGISPDICPKEPEDGFVCFALGTNLKMKVNTILFHYMRPLPEGGCELRSRFWMGYGMENGKPKLCLPPSVKLPRQLLRNTWEHNILEYSRLRDLMPLLYAEYGDKPLDFGISK